MDGYYCPEQEDFRSDLYSVGMVAFHWLYGSMPTRDSNHKILTDELNIDPNLFAVLTKATVYHPDGRYQTADEFINALEDYLKTYSEKTFLEY